jgi:antitoxin (DNA-binding transcriptional repressor) of toxin-antitoxin stability system
MSKPKLSGEILQSEEGIVVLVTFGDAPVVRLIPIRDASADAFKKSGEDDVEAFHNAIIAETVAPLLEHIFDQAQTDLGYE